MTWNEFKKEVDRQLEEEGISGGEEIGWIDTDPHGIDRGQVHVCLEGGIVIS